MAHGARPRPLVGGRQAAQHSLSAPAQGPVLTHADVRIAHASMAKLVRLPGNPRVCGLHLFFVGVDIFSIYPLLLI